MPRSNDDGARPADQAGASQGDDAAVTKLQSAYRGRMVRQCHITCVILYLISCSSTSFSLIGNTCRMGKLSNRGEQSGNQSKVYFSFYQSAIGAEERGGDPHREAPPLPAQSLGFDFIHLSASS